MSKRGYFACTDRGRSGGQESSSSRNQEPARLEAFALPANSIRVSRDAAPKAFDQVLFVGPASTIPLTQEVRNSKKSYKNESLCLVFDVRLSKDPASRLTIKFR